MRLAYFTIVMAFMVSFVVAMTRAIDAAEASTANLGLVGILSLGGILLVANDGIGSYDRLITFLQRVVVAGAAMAALGLVQFVTGDTWVDRVSIPGLSASQALGAVSARAGFNRPSGTALHAIEFGVVITMILPLALNLAIAEVQRNAVRRWTPVLLLLFASVVSISRSALVGVAVGLLVVVVRWPRRARVGLFLLAPLFGLGVFVTVPGLSGTLLGLFTGISGDTSAQSRTGSYAIAGEFIARSPLFGRGYATFLPIYRIFDNQYLLLMVEVGIVGTLAVMGTIVAGIVCADLSRRRWPGFAGQQMAQAVKASLAVAGVELALFDGFSFPIAAGMLFLMLGVAGAMWRIVRHEVGGTEPTSGASTVPTQDR